MDILWFYLSPELIDFISGVIGNFLGFVGTIIAAFIAARLARKHELQKREDEKLTFYGRACLRAEIDLNSLITSLHANIRLLEKGNKLILEDGVMMNLPRVVTLDSQIMSDFRNQELVNQWLKLRVQIDIVNHQILDYRDYYLLTTSEVHKMLIHDKKPKPQIIRQDYKMLHDFGNDIAKALKLTTELALDTYALISVHAVIGNHEHLQFKKFKDMNQYRAPESAIQKERESIVSRFNPDDIFLDLNEGHK